MMYVDLLHAVADVVYMIHGMHNVKALALHALASASYLCCQGDSGLIDRYIMRHVFLLYMYS